MEGYIPAQGVETVRRSKLSLQVFLPASVRHELWAVTKPRLAALLVLMLVAGGFWWRWGWMTIALGGMGLVMGFVVMEIDYLIRLLSGNNEHQTQLRNEVRDFNFVGFWKGMVDEVRSRPATLLRSVLFQTVIGLLGVYVVFSSGYVFAKALVWAVGARIIFEQVLDLLSLQSVEKWFWQLDLKMTQQIQNLWVFVWILLWIALGWRMI